MIKLWGILKGLLIQESADRSKQLSVEVDAAATTATRTTLKSAQTANRTVNLPDADDTLVGKATTDTLINKTIDGDDNTIQDVSITSLKTELADAGKFIERDGSGAVVSGKSVPGGDVVGNSDTQTLTYKTIDGTSATGTNTISADAADITYNNTSSGLTATTSQAAIDEVEGRLDTTEANKLDGPGTHGDNLLIKTDGVDTNNSQVTGISIDDLNNITGVNDLTVNGNLQVDGTTTSVNSTNLEVTDANITVNNNGNDASSEGAGLTVERTGTDGSLIYEDALASKFKLGALGAEVEIADVSTAQTITNKDMSSATNNVDTASANSLTRLTGNQQVVTIPDTATPDNFLLEAQSQVVTNKDIDGGTASNTSRITLPKGSSATLDTLTRKEGTVLYDTDLETIVVDDGVNLNRISGGAGGINYVPNSDGEAGVSGYNAYDDTNATPTDGTGGSPSAASVTPVILAADVVRGEKSIGILKSSSNGQGEGISIDLDPIANADKNKLLQITFEYKNIGVTPENYSSGDIRVYVYDIDNAQLLTDQLNSDDGDILFNENGTFVGSFYATNSANYRLIFHIRTTNASAYALSVDSVKVAPISVFVPASTKNEIETKILSTDGVSNGTLTDLTFSNLEIGKTYEVVGQIALAIDSGASDVSVGVEVKNGAQVLAQPFLRLSETADTSQDDMYSGISLSFVATATTLTVEAFSASANSYIRGDATRQFTYIQLEKRNDLNTNVVSNSQLNQTAVTATAGGAAQTIPNNAFTTINISAVYDPLNTITGNQFIAQTKGLHTFSIGWGHGNNPSGTSTMFVYLHKNGVEQKRQATVMFTGATSWVADLTHSLYLEKGDAVEMRGYQSSGSSATLDLNSTYFNVTSHPTFTTYGVLNPNSEYIESKNTTLTNYPIASDVWGDLDSIPLPPGEWDLIAQVPYYANGATTTQSVSTGISTTAGTSPAGLDIGDNLVSNKHSQTSGTYTTNTVNYKVNITETTTYYLKTYAAASATNLQVAYKISARRIK